MEKIINKIKHHKVLGANDIKYIIDILKNKYDINDYVKKVEFHTPDSFCMMTYNVNIKTLSINKIYKRQLINEISNIPNLRISIVDNRNEYLIDTYNLILIFDLLHELRHMMQWKEYDKHTNIIINSSLDSVGISSKYYSKYWISYYIEHDANMFAGEYIINLINNELNDTLDDKVKGFINRYVIDNILRAYGYEMDYNNSKYERKYALHSPSNLLQKLMFIDSTCNYKKFKKLSNRIKLLEQQDLTCLEKIKLGLNIDDDLIDYLISLCTTNTKVNNIFEELQNIEDNNFNVKTKKRISF